MGRLLGLMLFCIGIGMVIGMLVTENVIIIISAAFACYVDITCSVDDIIDNKQQK